MGAGPPDEPGSPQLDLFKRQAETASFKPWPGPEISLDPSAPPTDRVLREYAVDFLARAQRFKSALKRARISPEDRNHVRFVSEESALKRLLAAMHGGHFDRPSLSRTLSARATRLSNARMNLLSSLPPDVARRIVRTESRSAHSREEIVEEARLAAIAAGDEDSPSLRRDGVEGELVQVGDGPRPAETTTVISSQSVESEPDAAPAVSPSAGTTTAPEGDEGAPLADVELRLEWEQRPLPAQGKLSTLLRGLPIQWLDAIAFVLGLPDVGNRAVREVAVARHLSRKKRLREIVEQHLQQDHLDLLRFLLEHKGVADKTAVIRRFGRDDGDGWFWSEDPPSSTLGVLRLRGLVYVGRREAEGRRITSVLLPRELRRHLRSLLRAANW